VLLAIATRLIEKKEMRRRERVDERE